MINGESSMKNLTLVFIFLLIISHLAWAGIGMGSYDKGILSLVEQQLSSAVARGEAQEAARETVRIALEVASTINAEQIRLRLIKILSNADEAQDAKEVLARAAREVAELKQEVDVNPGSTIRTSADVVR